MTPPRGSAPVRTKLNAGWQYSPRGDLGVAQLSSLAPHEWESVSLPHTWNALDPTDAEPGYRCAASWYRRPLDVPDLAGGGRLLLKFEGANLVADVYVNGARAGGHVGGYLGFTVDITPFVKPGQRNELAVRVDNSDDPALIPSDKADYAIFGGLTRDVWLVAVPAVSLARLAVRTPAVSRDRARAEATVELYNPGRLRGTRALTLRLLGPDGRPRSSTRVAVTLTGDTVQPVPVRIPEVRRPALWSPASPSLYRLSASLAGDGAAEDTLIERIGFRFFRFESHGTFSLNGEPLFIRGTHRHEERAGLGAALTDAMHREDMAMIKAMGANFVRLGHYPQDPAVYAAADSLGLLVWDELPWNRGGLGDERWKDNTRRLLREQVRQNVNHPSIILWSMANEPDDVIDPGHGTPPEIAAFVAELTAIAHALDPDRPTAMRKFDAGFTSVDVYSPSIWAGWYGGVYRNYEKSIVTAQGKFPRMVHMEYGADGHVGRHTASPITGEGMRIEQGTAEAVGVPVRNIAREGDWSESYQVDLLDWHLTVAPRIAGFAGNAQWVFRDFATPLRPENPIPYVNQKGIIARDGTPKDAWYLYRAHWTTSPRFVYIVSHSWPERFGAPGAPAEVRTYSNCARVELLLGGASQGMRVRDATSFPAQGLRWEVPLREGENALTARCVGDADASAPHDSVSVRYTTARWGTATRIAVRTTPASEGGLLLEATLVDAQGRTCQDCEQRIYFSHQGAGRMAADLGTPTGSRVIEAANGRAAIRIVPPAPGERAMITVRTQDLNGTRILLEGRGMTVNP
ncbi:MAG TPA: glycoside hydrolase family 2 TIM barrel-domain containing protein [Gemmatimonadaceae bacterium]